ncbi:MAG: hypothetical protein CVV42_01750 [Candidatus Riflebacteria bacterium HGW-Riflebacteria-2]|jgi:hypothetical protein|nr:MAG: hypothetical protein CVV42_01750 [Candidatus Riflebacteria bacterium HGW-Riflebacteria-2]
MLIRFLALIAVLMATPAFASQELYVPPRSLELKMVLNGNKGVNHWFSAEVKSLLGSLRNVKVYYEASDGLDCDLAPAPTEILAEGETKTFEFGVRLSEKQAADPKTWVRFRVEYLPDYAAIKERINSDNSSYPDENLRQRLLEIIDQNFIAKAHAIDAIRHFFTKTEE